MWPGKKKCSYGTGTPVQPASWSVHRLSHAACNYFALFKLQEQASSSYRVLWRIFLCTVMIPQIPGHYFLPLCVTQQFWQHRGTVGSVNNLCFLCKRTFLLIKPDGNISVLYESEYRYTLWPPVWATFEFPRTLKIESAARGRGRYLVSQTHVSFSLFSQRLFVWISQQLNALTNKA